jgi:hypothetical protein
MIQDKLSGHYIVDNKIFYDKIEAILYANQKLLDIEWNFFDNIFNSLDWSTEPETSLDELYRLRAKQLREKYDYIIVFCSGGADSTQVLYSFLKNGIKVDEVYAGAPLSGLKRFTPTDKIVDQYNVISETYYAQLPFLEEIKSNYPEVKITVNDYFEDILKYKEDQWIFESSDWIHPTTIARYSLEKFDHIKKICESGKSVAAIYGNNKPNVTIVDGKFVNILNDLAMNVARPAFRDYPVSLEPFYISPDFPLISVKQSHEVIKNSLKPENKYLLEILEFKSSSSKLSSVKFHGKNWNHGIYERAIVPIIYPNLNYNKFQGLKPSMHILADHDAWFYSLHKDTTSYKMMLSDISNFLNVVNKKYFENQLKTAFKIYKKTYEIKNFVKE